MFLRACKIPQDKVNVYEEETASLEIVAVWLLYSLEYLKGS